jgi:hypothetical protein
MHEHGRSLVRKLEGKPFMIVGVNSDANRDKVKAMAAKKGPAWRSFWDGGSTCGPIQSRWNIQAYPTMYLIDHNGIIVGRTYPIGEGAELIERKVKEAETALQR